jgi:hypothetical protein
MDPDGTSFVFETVQARLYNRGMAAHMAMLNNKTISPEWASTNLLQSVQSYQVYRDQKLLKAFINGLWSAEIPFELKNFTTSSISGAWDTLRLEHVVHALTGLERMLAYVFGSIYIGSFATMKHRIEIEDFSPFNPHYIAWELQLYFSNFFDELSLPELKKGDVKIDLSTQENVFEYLVVGLASLAPSLQCQESFFTFRQESKGTTNKTVKSTGTTPAARAQISQTPTFTSRNPGDFCRQSVAYGLLTSTLSGCGKSNCPYIHYDKKTHTGPEVRAWWARLSQTMPKGSPKQNAYTKSLGDVIQKLA